MMTNAIHAVRQFQPFLEYLQEGKQSRTPNPHVEKADLMTIEPSSHVVISREGRQKLAAERQTEQQFDWEL
ncbi:MULTISPECIES: hypothetical protein [Paraburkholderia]|nr:MULTISPECIES: hypothetical protein [Paraburkholderia]AUT60292.1 hypothetical protein C2L65_12245 [Paraburkholderia terrae]AXE99371.1 hypothetical protein CUJ88_13545 [Paraburkholderia hospita]MDW3657231.1 hypothetical protein [Paraburkholderia terrae]BCZ78717.1 hypothetical protein PTKU64_23920 [Paraburkholderia terrae]BDC39248.1 hypothetical protein PTKU15_25450 [Paraburkholderia terrae]